MNREKTELLNELDKLEKDDISDKERVRREKEKFILQIKSGLGEKIKNNPNKVNKIKKPLLKKIIENIKYKIIYIFKMF